MRPRKPEEIEFYQWVDERLLVRSDGTLQHVYVPHSILVLGGTGVPFIAEGPYWKERLYELRKELTFHSRLSSTI